MTIYQGDSMRVSCNMITVFAAAVTVAMVSLPRPAVAQQINGCWYTDSAANCSGSQGRELCTTITSQSGCSWDGHDAVCSSCGSAGCNGYGWTLSCCNTSC